MNFSYFLRSGDNAPYQRYVYVIHIDSQESKCLTCDMTTSRGPCTYASASFSKDLSYVTKICQGPGPYLVEIQSTQDVSSFSIAFSIMKGLILHFYSILAFQRRTLTF